MAQLILGPLLRHIAETTATVWVETDAPCEVEVLGHKRRTFTVAGHHYALVDIGGLKPNSSQEYSVTLDGEERWPEAGSPYPPSLIRTLGPRSFELAFGSCRVAAPHEPPYTESHGIDALWALSEQMRHESPEHWPAALLMLGDQVYADALSPQAREFIRARRAVHERPYDEVADFEEYTRLYWEAWGEPSIRWLFASLPTAMIFDDHDIHDDWNTSEAWRADMAKEPWWPERITSGLVSYWVYQHLGNLPPAARAADELYQRAHAADDLEPLLRDFAQRANETTDGTQWSYVWELGSSRLVVIDSRAGRVLADGQREMIDEEEWQFVAEQMRGEVDHLLLATSLPYLLPRALHEIEAWNEAVCAGAWGRLAGRLGEQIRRAVDLEHWAAFEQSFRRLSGLIEEAATGQRPPASIVVLSGDVHYAYVAKARFGHGKHAPVYQAVCSPLRNALPRVVKLSTLAMVAHKTVTIARALARRAGVAPPPIDWDIEVRPFFDNQLATLALDGREASLRFEGARLGDRGPSLEALQHCRLAPEVAIPRSSAARVPE